MFIMSLKIMTLCMCSNECVCGGKRGRTKEEDGVKTERGYVNRLYKAKPGTAHNHFMSMF